MRKKIAKRKRRYIISKGAKIVLEEKVEGGIIVEVEYLGWHIMSPDHDELSAYQGITACLPICEEDPMTE